MTPVRVPPGGELFAEFAENAGDDPPPTIVTDPTDRQFGGTALVADMGLVQVALDETDGELPLGLSVLPTG